MNDFPHLSSEELRKRQLVQEDVLETIHPDDPEAKMRIETVHDLAEERRRRTFGDAAVSHSAQQIPGGAPIDSKRWRE